MARKEMDGKFFKARVRRHGRRRPAHGPHRPHVSEMVASVVTDISGAHLLFTISDNVLLSTLVIMHLVY
jgi:hypothetical protein